MLWSWEEGGRKDRRRNNGDSVWKQQEKWTSCGIKRERVKGLWDGGGRGVTGVRALAIILHRFTPVRDGWTGNEVWDLGVCSTRLSGPYSFVDVLWGDVSCVCVCVLHANGKV